jgi:glyceraldehyde 3-phosphate dehydrogenase
MLRVAINGYGRIGRNVHRQFVQRFSDQVEVVAINASTDSEVRAYLLKRDSIHGKFDAEVEVVSEDAISVNGKEVVVLKERDPAKLPWKKLKIDVVVESTGKFRTTELAGGHLTSGAKRVVISAPPKDDTPTFVKGVNDEHLTGDMTIISNASCTTNCIAPVIKVIDEEFGIEHGLIATVHAYTASQNLLDNKPPGSKDIRRARSTTISMIPTTTGAVKACGIIFPHLKGKLHGMALRIPLPTVSVAYMALEIKKNVSAEEINAALKKSSDGAMKGILGFSEEPLVSIDFQSDPRSSIVDAISTEVVDGKAAQILSWYDNEWGYAMRLTEMVVKVGELMK